MAEDLPLFEDLAAVYVEAQKRVDRVIAARVELGAALNDLHAGRDSMFAGVTEAVKFIDDYLNPTVPNPAPISPETVDVALPVEAEIPVFTTVDDAGLTSETTSGGEVDDVEVVEDFFGDFIPAPEPIVEDVVEEELLFDGTIVEEEVVDEITPPSDDSVKL